MNIIFKKLFLIINILFLAMISFGPGFSAWIPAVGIAQAAQQESIFIVKIKTGDDNFLLNDPKILQVEHIFENPKSDLFKNIYRVQCGCSLQDFTSEYSSQIVYAQMQNNVRSGALTVSQPTTSNDPGFSGDLNTDRQWGLVKAQFTSAWTVTRGSIANTVAVIDTGIDALHEDLSDGQVSAGYNFINHTVINIGENSDDNGHGTLIAGIIGASTNNFRGIAGTNWNITLMPIKALDAKGQGNSADVAAAIVWAADNGAKIINLSLGGIGFANDTTLSNAVSYAFNKGDVIVAAAGNDVAVNGGDLDQNPVFPICDDNGQNMIVGVAATDVNDQKATFSNYGKSCVDVSAPGKRILSTINIDPVTHQSTENGYAYASGTSLAAPFVSGEAALIWSAFPNITNLEVRDRILKSADPIDALNETQCNGGSCDGELGTGRINALQALDPNLLPHNLPDGSVARADGSSNIYYISAGQKSPISQFVFNKRFANSPILSAPQYLLDSMQTTLPTTPQDGVIVRGTVSKTVYYMLGGFKRPVTAQVFQQRGIQASDVNAISDNEVNSWLTSTFMPPNEGTLVRAYRNPTVYWVVDGLLHPINYQFWQDRGLNIFPILHVPDNDIKNYAQGNAFIR